MAPKWIWLLRNTYDNGVASAQLKVLRNPVGIIFRVIKAYKMQWFTNPHVKYAEGLHDTVKIILWSNDGMRHIWKHLIPLDTGQNAVYTTVTIQSNNTIMYGFCFSNIFKRDAFSYYTLQGMHCRCLTRINYNSIIELQINTHQSCGIKNSMLKL